MERLQRDRRVMECVFPDTYNLGVFAVDLREFKTLVIAEINIKENLVKEHLFLVCVNALQSNTDLEKNVRQLLDMKPTTISQFIQINLYIEGEEHAAQIASV